jgi:hypothetical protein
MRAAKICAAVCASSFVFAVACGGKMDAQDSCGAFFDRLTGILAQCGAPELPDPAGRDSFVAYCDALARAPGVKDLAAQYDACAQNLDPNVCGGPQCAPRGTLAAGAACTDGAQCASGMCGASRIVAPTSEQTCGTCLALVEQGASCGPSAPCDAYANLYCDTASGTCQPVAGLGASCAKGEACDGELYCDGQTCQPLPEKGQPCTDRCTAAYACIGGVCGDRVAAGGACPHGDDCELGLSCDPETHVCNASVGEGAACGGPEAHFALCAAGLVCTSDDICEAPKPQGAPCVAGQLECATDLVCANGRCELPDFTLCQ